MKDMSAETRTTLLRQLFDPQTGIGLSYLRIPIGGNDFDYSRRQYSEEEKAGSFRLSSEDTEYLIPVLDQIRAINPQVQILATPWTAPRWMKCNRVPVIGSCILSGSWDGGYLRVQDEAAYAQYLARFVREYEANQIPISAITVDNEPNDPNDGLPSMNMSATQAVKVAGFLRLAFAEAGLSNTEIVGLDDNWNSAKKNGQAQSNIQYAEQLLQSGDFGGIAFHAYSGRPEDIVGLQQNFPNAALYETESTPTGRGSSAFANDLVNNTREEIIRGIGSGSRTAMLWNLVLNNSDGPTINKGCLSADCQPLASVTPASRTKSASFTPEVGYDVLGQVSKFVQPGAFRVSSTTRVGKLAGKPAEPVLETVAFKNVATGRIVLVALNNDKNSRDKEEEFSVRWEGMSFTYRIPPDSVETFVWEGVPSGSCAPSSSLIVLVKGHNVVSYVPKGSWSFGKSGVSAVNVEGSAITPTRIETPAVVNSCAPNPLTGLTVCSANDDEVYVINGTKLERTLASAGTGDIGFSGGDCTNCGVAMDAVHNRAIIGLSVSEGPSEEQHEPEEESEEELEGATAAVPAFAVDQPGFQTLELGTMTFGSAFASPAHDISEDPLIDPVRQLLLSPAENGDFEIVDVSDPSSPRFYENQTGLGDLDSAAEDCSTGIALAPAEEYQPSHIFIANLGRAEFTPGSPAGSWSAPSQSQVLSDSELSAGATGIAVAQGTHTGVVTGEFGGNRLTAFTLPSQTSGEEAPAIADWVSCSIAPTPSGEAWSEGDDPHTVAAYQSPSSGDAFGLFGNGLASWLARIDLTKLLDPSVVPRTSGGHACASGVIPSSLENFIAVP